MLSDAGIDVVFSGHTHTSQLITPAEGNAAFPAVIARGDAWNEKDYLVIRTEITEQQMIIYYENMDGIKEEVLRITPKERSYSLLAIGFMARLTGDIDRYPVLYIN